MLKIGIFRLLKIKILNLNFQKITESKKDKDTIEKYHLLNGQVQVDLTVPLLHMMLY